MNSDLTDQLQSLACDVDRALAAGLTLAAKQSADNWPDRFEWERSLHDLLHLSQGGDAFYDRPTVGVAYAFWYHLRRVNPLVHELASQIDEADLEIIDLGSGTGATAWAAAWVVAARNDLGLSTGNVVVHEIEAGPSMLSTADTLWEQLLIERNDVANRVQRRSILENWTTAAIHPTGRSLLVASYLMDHSDQARAEEVGLELASLANRCGATSAVLLSNPSKRRLVEAAVTKLEESAWQTMTDDAAAQLWSGVAPEVSQARREHYGTIGMTDDHMLHRDVTFSGERPHMFRLQRRAFQAPLINERGWDLLNPAQRQPVGSNRRARLVLGAAGSGKSLVLASAIAQELESVRPRAPHRMLVTAFNKDVVQEIDRILTERLPISTLEGRSIVHQGDGHFEYRNVGSRQDHVTLINWDKIPGRMFNVPSTTIAPGNGYRSALISALADLQSSDQRFAELADDDRLLDPDFYIAELTRVVFGLGATNRQAYLDIARTGRGVRLVTEQRAMVADVLLRTDMPKSFTHRRIEALRAARRGEGPEDISAIFIDEAQDFLPGDFALVNALLMRNGKAFVVVDETQAVHIGGSYQSPPGVPGTTWKRFELKGSYRLPAAQAHAVHPLAEQVRAKRQETGSANPDLMAPISRKASVVGVRPILVVGTEAQVACQIAEIQGEYRSLLEAEAGPTEAFVLESDKRLANAVVQAGGRATSSTVLRIKGLERRMVVWSTRVPIRSDQVLEETAYTVLTRSTCLLIIAVDVVCTGQEEARVVRSLDQRYLMPWTEAAEHWLHN